MARPEAQDWLRPALLVVGLVTLARVATLWASPTDLYVDESQYWLWGQSLDFGYFSKPPMIGWVLRLFDELAVHRSAFSVRLPAPLFHGATALILGAWAQALMPGTARAGLWVALAYVTLPIVAVGSFLISTDTIMAPFLAGALLLYWRICAGGGTGTALAGGALLGGAFLSKYAAIYFLPGALIAYALIPSMRPRPGALALFALAFALVAGPNIAWNVAHDLTTVSHTMDNAAWIKGTSTGPQPSLPRLLEFIASQFLVFGPVLMVFWIAALRAPAPGRLRALLWFSVPVWAIVALQALLARAYANWAFAAILPATLAAVFWALSRGRLRALRAGLALNIALCVLIPFLTLFPTLIGDGKGQPLAKRYVNVADLTHDTITLAHAQGLDTVVASSRAVLADFFFTGADSGLAFYARPFDGPPHHYYEQKKALPADLTGPVLYVAYLSTLSCDGVEQTPVADLTQPIGSWAEGPIPAYVVDAECLR